MRRSIFAALLFLILLPDIAFADRCHRMLRRLVGWTIVAETSVDGDFNGCEYGRRIRLQDGSVFVCAEYNYSYAYSPEVIVLAKRTSTGNRQLVQIKLLIEGELFEMSPVTP